MEEKAKKYCKEKHKGQTYNGGPFWKHPFQTAKILKTVTKDKNLIVAGYLHDILEDTDTSYNELEQAFGSDITDLVVEVTQAAWNDFPNLKTRRGVMLKFADRLSNITNSENWSEEQRNRYIFQKSKFWK